MWGESDISDSFAEPYFSFLLIIAHFGVSTKT